MTWTKLGDEFFDDCANAGLSDAAVRTHAEAIGWLYRVESEDVTIKKHLVRRFAGSERWESAVAELVAAGFWLDTAAGYKLDHHADVLTASLVAQQAKRSRDRKAQAKHRDKVSADISDGVSADVMHDVSALTDRQTDRQDAGKERTEHERIDLVTGEVLDSTDPWVVPVAQPVPLVPSCPGCGVNLAGPLEKRWAECADCHRQKVAL